ncbi:MAG: hypothetical protein ACM3H7_00680, partial [Acidobacteriaceae bacterium]
MDFLINPIDGNSEKDLSRAEGDAGQSETDSIADGSQEDQLPAEFNSQSPGEAESDYAPAEETPQDAGETQPGEDFITPDTSQEEQLFDVPDVPSGEEEEPVYTPIEVAALEDFTLQADVADIGAEASGDDMLVSATDMPSTADTQPVYSFQEVEPPQEFDPLSNGDLTPSFPSQPEQPQEDYLPVDETSTETAEPDDQQTLDGEEQSFEINGSLSPMPEAPQESSKKIALVLSGGGARGAFQVGAEMYARQVK